MLGAAPVCREILGSVRRSPPHGFHILSPGHGAGQVWGCGWEHCFRLPLCLWPLWEQDLLGCRSTGLRGSCREGQGPANLSALGRHLSQGEHPGVSSTPKPPAQLSLELKAARSQSPPHPTPTVVPFPAPRKSVMYSPPSHPRLLWEARKE